MILLTRTPVIHVIPQGNYINNLGREKEEMINWMNERVGYLNREMQMMESRLERMRHEFMYLRKHLQDLQTLSTDK